MAVVEDNNFKEQRLQRKEEHDREEDDEEEEALSLCDLPIAGRDNCKSNETSSSSRNAFEAQDFEFGSWAEEDPIAMCAADDVFFKGQILPLRPSVSSETGNLLSGVRPDSQKTSRSGSRSDSMERSLGNSSLVFSSSTGSNRSSSRSHSLSSSSSTYNNFHSHPTPKPQMNTHPRRNASKTSRKSSGWGLFRLGLVKTPEIELQDLKFRNRSNICKSESLISPGRRSTGSDGGKKPPLEKMPPKQEHGLQRFFGGGLSCKCSADDTISSKIVILKSRKRAGDEQEEEEEESFGKQAMSHRRTFEWLRALSIAEAPLA